MNGDFRIGFWLVQPTLNIISSGDASVRLEPKVMEVLVRLAREPGVPVSKEDLLNTVWPNTFVSDDVVVRAISELRRVFGDEARKPQIIQTISKRGYRLLLPAQVAADPKPAIPASVTGYAPRHGLLGRVPLLFLTAGLVLLTTVALLSARWHVIGRQQVSRLQPSANLLQLPTPADKQRHILSAQAFNPRVLEAYLQGRSHQLKLSGGVYFGHREKFEEEFTLANQFFRQAISEDPNYPPAYLGIAEMAMGPGRFLHPGDGLRQTARSAVLKALAIDPNLAQAHLDLARVEFWSWNWQAAEREFKRAIELDPNLAQAHELYGGYLQAVGRVDESRAESERSQALDPLNSRMAWVYYVDRRFDRFIELKHNDVVIGAHGPMAHFDLGFGYERAGRYKEAVDEWEKAMVGFGYNRLATALHRGYSQGGFKGAMRAWAAGWELVALSGEPVHPEMPAYCYSVLKENDRAFAWLEKGFQIHSTGMPFLAIDPTWDDIRSDPRFTALVRRVGLSPDRSLEARAFDADLHPRPPAWRLRNSGPPGQR